MTKRLSTVEEVISELGGYDAVRELTKSAAHSVVPMWKFRGYFPPRTYTVMKAALLEKGLDAPDSLWNMAEAS